MFRQIEFQYLRRVYYVRVILGSDGVTTINKRMLFESFMVVGWRCVLREFIVS